MYIRTTQHEQIAEGNATCGNRMEQRRWYVWPETKPLNVFIVAHADALTRSLVYINTYIHTETQDHIRGMQASHTDAQTHTHTHTHTPTHIHNTHISVMDAATQYDSKGVRTVSGTYSLKGLPVECSPSCTTCTKQHKPSSESRCVHAFFKHGSSCT